MDTLQSKSLFNPTGSSSCRFAGQRLFRFYTVSDKKQYVDLNAFDLIAAVLCSRILWLKMAF